MLRFEVLGNLEVLRDGVGVDLTAKPRELLACLLLARGATVSSARLCELLWGDDGHRGTLDTTVGRLRTAIDPDTNRPQSRYPATVKDVGYVLAVDEGTLDAERFLSRMQEAAAAAGRGDWRSAAERYRQGLAEWRGERVVADLRARGFAHPAADDLERRRRDARREAIRIEASRLGRSHLPDLEWLAATDLGHAADAELLLHALHARGERDQVEEAYLRYEDAVTGRGRKVDARLAALHLRLRSGAEPVRPVPGADPVEGAAGAAPRIPADLVVGRDEELRELHAALSDAREGRGCLLWISGGAGIGKKTLAGVFAREARGLDVEVIRDRQRRLTESTSEGGHDRLLAQWRKPRTDAEARRLLGPQARELAARPAAAELTGAHDDTPARAEPPSRRGLAEALAEVLRRSAAERPLVLVLEDLQYASPLPLMLLQALAVGIDETPLLVVALYSDRISDQREELDDLRATLPRSPRSMKLRGLAREHVRALLAAALPVEPSERLVTRLHERTAGNPHFVTEIVRGLRQGPPPDDIAGWERRLEADVPEDIQHTTRWRLRLLEQRAPGVTRMLQAASVIGHEFDLPLLRRVTQVDDAVLLELLHQAMAHDFVEPVAGGSGFRFLTRLERDAIYRRVSSRPADHSQFHLRAGLALEELQSASRRQPAMLAEHFKEASLTAEGAAKARRYLREAGDLAADRLAFEDAAQHYREALQRVQDDGERCALLLALGDVELRAADPDGAQVAFEEAADLARALREPALFARAALGLGTAFSHFGLGTSRLIELLEEALELLGAQPVALRAEVLGRLAVAHYWVDPALHTRRPAERDQLSAEALRIARTLDEPQVLVDALDARSHSICGPDASTHAERVRLADELVETARRARNRPMGLQGRLWRIVHLLEHGETERLDAELGKYTAAAQRLDRAPQRFWVEAWRGMRELSQARFGAAEDAVAGARELARGLPHAALLHHSVDVLAFYLHYVQGREAEVADIVTGAASAAPGLLAWRLPVTLCALAAGRRDDAAAAFRRFTDADLDRLPRDAVHVATLGLLAEVCARTADVDRALVLYRRLLPYEHLHIAVGFASASDGPVAHYLGRLAVVREQWGAAATHLELAVSLAAASGAVAFRLRSEVELAGVLLADPARWREGRDLAVGASKTAALHGAGAIEARAEALLDGGG